ncbi:MAG: YchJ family metal-binding protein [Pseudomonadota bacterium]|nr:YchJ family metal-binding protein [Pseudomonadota bacterium]
MNNKDSKLCPCGTERDYETCCAPFISGKSLPPTAEALMRSRYTAYAISELDYIKKTLATASSKDFDPVAAKEWANQSEWKGLKIISTDLGKESDKTGTVEFAATYSHKEKTYEHHEVSQFQRNGKGEWRFVDGESHTHEDGEGHQHHHEKTQPMVRESAKVGRNDACPCGSGKKYKKCCSA